MLTCILVNKGDWPRAQTKPRATEKGYQKSCLPSPEFSTAIELPTAEIGKSQHVCVAHPI
eukprot:1161263-Pelagomonas_calceolata.AAC.18